MVTQDRATQLISHIFLALFSIICIIPFVILISSSLTAEELILTEGYNFIPAAFSFEAYEYLMKNSGNILRAYGITIIVTVVGTVVSLAITAMIAYALSRRIR